MVINSKNIFLDISIGTISKKISSVQCNLHQVQSFSMFSVKLDLHQIESSIGYTVFPRLARILWQPKNRASRNSCYASQNVTFYSGCTRGIEDILERYYSFIFDAKELEVYSFEFILIKK